MNALTFDSISTSPRRAAVRRVQPPAFRVISKKEQPATIAPILRPEKELSQRKQFGLIALSGIVIALHLTVVAFLHNDTAPTTHVKTPPLAIEIAPPPVKPLPPPPIIKPKPLPQVVKKATPEKVQPRPVLPIVSETTPVDTKTPAENTVQVATAPEPTPPAPPPPAPVEKVTEPKGFAGYLSNPAPTYPEAAQRRGLQGKVILKVHVLASGKPDTVTIAKSSGHGILDEAAIKAVTAWTFDPAKRGQTPIDGWVQVPLNFVI